MKQINKTFTKFCVALGAALVVSTAFVGQVFAAELTIANGSVGNDQILMRRQLDEFQKLTGHTVNIAELPASTTEQLGLIKTYLSAGAQDIDVYQVDVIWAPLIATHLVDLGQHYATSELADYFDSIVQSQTVDGRMVAIPLFTDAGMLYYRKDLLQKYNKPVPKTWVELTRTAREIQDKERAAGNKDMWGFVFQGKSYEGLTCDALEWIYSYGGGQIIEPDGTVSINNPNAIKALAVAKSWIGNISPAGVLGYGEEEARAVWQVGNAVFMRNWPYAYSLGNSDDSAIKGKFDVAVLPAGGSGKGAATLGGWNLAVSKYSRNADAAVELVKFLSGKEMQKFLALEGSRLPTRKSLYKDADILSKIPFFGNMETVFLNAVPRPSAPAKRAYDEVSNEFFNSVYNTLAGKGSVKGNVAELEKRLKRIMASVR